MPGALYVIFGFSFMHFSSKSSVPLSTCKTGRKKHGVETDGWFSCSPIWDVKKVLHEGFSKIRLATIFTYKNPSSSPNRNRIIKLHLFRIASVIQNRILKLFIQMAKVDTSQQDLFIKRNDSSMTPVIYSKDRRMQRDAKLW